MKITRSIMRKIILREMKKVARNEVSIIEKLTDGEDAQSIAAKLKAIEKLDDLVIDLIPEDAETLRPIISGLSKEKKQLFVDVTGMLRQALAPSTYTKVKTAIESVSDIKL
jgi:hypothetical protein